MSATVRRLDSQQICQECPIFCCRYTSSVKFTSASIPAMYFSRVARIFEDVKVSKQEIECMITCGGTGLGTRVGNNGLQLIDSFELEVHSPEIVFHWLPSHLYILPARGEPQIAKEIILRRTNLTAWNSRYQIADG